MPSGSGFGPGLFGRGDPSASACGLGLFGRGEGAMPSGSASRLFGQGQGSMPRGGSRETGENNEEKKEEPSPHSVAQKIDIGSTQAGELGYGKTFDEKTSTLALKFSEDHRSEPAILCLSLWRGMEFLPLPDIEGMLQAETEQWIKNEGKALIESLNAVYKTDTCVVDLESEADTIVCTCGHQCLHHSNVVANSNLNACPLCRAPITAFVRADGLVLD